MRVLVTINSKVTRMYTRLQGIGVKADRQHLPTYIKLGDCFADFSVSKSYELKINKVLNRHDITII